MAKLDYYEVLGVERGADEAAIKRAYRNLAMQYHPDRNPSAGAAEKMKEINEAYAVLSNGEKRRLYDTYGHAGLEGFTQDDIFRGVDFAGLFRDLGLGGFGLGGSIFEGLFGTGTGRGQVPRRGADLRFDLEVSLEEVAQGGEHVIELPRRETCPDCGGTGAAPGGLVQCDQCRGTGQLVVERRSGTSLIRQISVCRKCGGDGQLVKDACPRCHGKGVLETSKKLTVEVPRGADTGQAVRVPGEGEPGEHGGPGGDLYVLLKVHRHPVFERHGDDLYLEKGITFTQAALGAEVSVPSLDGDLKLEVPEGTQTGRVFRLMDHGMPRLESRRKGDLYVVVKVVTPTRLSPEARELLTRLATFDRGEAGDAGEPGPEDARGEAGGARPGGKAGRKSRWSKRRR